MIPNYHLQLKRWQKQIPAMKCSPGCHACCEGYAPSMTKAEWYEIKHPGKFSRGKTIETCPFLGASGCEIYSRRPLICRLFGTVEADQLNAFNAFCPSGETPARPLSLRQALKIQTEYEGELWNQACKLIIQFISYLKMPGETKPAPMKFQYLRYLFSTPDGQKGLALLMGIDPGILPGDKLAQMQAIMEGI